jgi:hypothetical protein
MNLNKYEAVIKYTYNLSTFSSDGAQELYRKDLASELDKAIWKLIAEGRLDATLSFLNTNMHTSFVDISAAHEHAKLHFPELLI